MKNRLAFCHAKTEPLVGYYNEWSATGDPRAPKCRKVNALAGVRPVRAASIAAPRS